MASLGRKLKTAFGILRDSGPTGLKRRLAAMKIPRRQKVLYSKWLEKHGSISADQLAWMNSTIESFAERPMISVILPVYNVDEKWLRLCIDSVINQIYPHWELCIADDASPSPHVGRVLQEYSANDSRIKLELRSENGHISAASNSALALATGELVALLDHDDELTADALFWVANEFNAYPRTAIIYSDEDLIDERGRRFAPKFKPDFSRDLLYSLNLLTHLSAYRTDLVRSIGGFRIGIEGSQDYDLELRAIEKIDDDQIRHIARVLYHWRVIRGSVAYSMDEKPYAHERARDAIRDHFERTGIRGKVVESFLSLHRVTYRNPDRVPPATVIVSTDVIEGNVCKRIGVAENYETVIVPVAVSDRAKLLNEAAARSKADVLVFLDGNLRFVDKEVIDELIAFAMQPDIGAVAGRIIRSDHCVEQAGIVIQPDLSPAFAHAGFPREAPGNMFRNRQISNYSAISVACMVVRRELFDELGGFNRSVTLTDLFDFDLCLRLWERNKRIVVLPHVELIRSGNVPQRIFRPEDLEAFRSRWHQYEDRDPFCNPNLKRDGSFGIDV
ncbi:MAG: glycosyltransferase [Blastocatellia bacterium]|nr:glycosyltransferase [Blastocatellia bacterium]